MPNMSYCRFENTVNDLQDCYDNWEVNSEEEERAQKRLVQLCQWIVADYGDDE